MPIASRVLLIGWDAADWKVAAPLIDSGKMPNLERLVSNGVMGNLATLYPVLSPMLWTSIATGKRAYKHGIHGFAEPDPQTGGVRPITSLGRKCKAVWNILNQCGKRSNVVGWWPTHPAEPINGVMISNHFQSARGATADKWPLPAGTVHPAALRSRLASLRVHPHELEAEQILPFVPKAAEVDLEKDKRLAMVAGILAETATVQAAATAVMQLEPWDFMAVYFDAIDHACHGFMKYHPPKLDRIPDGDFEIYKGVVSGMYQFHDMMLGTMLHLAGEETVVVLVSDHGFHPDHLRPEALPNEPAGPAEEHRDFGIFVMSGPGIRKDELVFGASLLDVTPTVLTLFGLPIAADMDGRPLLTAFEEPPSPEPIATWESIEGDDGRHPPDMQVDATSVYESLQQLADLGYIERPGADAQEAATHAARELRYNLARDYFGARRMAEATPLFAQLWDEYPDESRFGIKLFDCCIAMQRTDEAQAVLERLIREKQRYAAEARRAIEALDKERQSKGAEPIEDKERQNLWRLRKKASFNPTTFSYLRGVLSLARKEYEEALRSFRGAEGVQVHNRPNLYLKMGECCLALRRWNDAIGHFERILEIDPINPEPRIGLARCHVALRRPALALEHAMAAIGLAYHAPIAHFVCGRALEQLRRLEESVKAYAIAISQNPIYPEAHRRLAAVYRRMNEEDLARKHEELSKVAEKRLEELRSGALPVEGADSQRAAARLGESASLGDRVGRHSGAPLSSETIVIVSGLPRSGTSMMMQMLEAGGLSVLSDNVRQADESNERGYYEYEPVKRLGRDHSVIEAARGKCVKLIAHLLPALPPGTDYRIIFVERTLGAIVDSQATMLERLGKRGGRLSRQELADTYRGQLERLRKFVTGQSDAISVLGIDYDDALREPLAAAAKINAFLGGALDEHSMAGAVDPRLRHLRA